MNPLKVYIGYDPREAEGYRVAEKSLRDHASVPVVVTPLNMERMADAGLLRRPQDTRQGRYDIISNAPCSTQFSISRFLTPILAQTGWALFIDCDMLFEADVAELFALADPRYAVQVVKHQQPEGAAFKMDHQPQVPYGRKNWSSVMLFNCDHPANRRLSLADVQERSGRDLHQFYWLADDEIGDLPVEWNWLVDVIPRPPTVKLAHYTLGGPFLPGWQGGSYDDNWYRAAS